MKIMDIIKSNQYVILKTTDKWLYWNGEYQEWRVMTYGNKNKTETRCLYSGDNEDFAVETLMQDET